MVRIKEAQIVVSDKEETALAVYWVTDGKECCPVSFLIRQMVKHKKKYNVRIAEIVEIFSEKSKSPSDRQKFYQIKGCCRAVLLDFSDCDILPVKKCQLYKIITNKQVKTQSKY